MPAVTVENMTCIERDAMGIGVGALYQEIVIVQNGLSSNAFFLPVQGISGIAMSIVGTGVVYLTFDSRATIAAGNADWTAWDGSSPLNLAVTAFYVVSNSGNVTAKINVRTNSY